MDRRNNPYAPGAGTRPPELAGRDAVIDKAAIALDRLRNGLQARGMILYGLRGVGKTVLLNHIRMGAEERRYACVKIEAPEQKSLPALIVPGLRAVLLRISQQAKLADSAKRAFAALAGFAKSFKVSYQGLEMEIEGAAPVPQTGDLDLDLKDLLVAVGTTAREQKTVVLLVIDELQYVKQAELGALIAALHEAGQQQLPITMVAAGLPQLLGQMGEAKSYAERLFEFVEIDRLPPEAARAALEVPAHKLGVAYDPGALDHVLAQSMGYAYFLQEWGKHCWDAANASPITRADAEQASVLALAELDASFFRVRFDRLTVVEKGYLRAMAELGPGPHRSGAIATKLGRKVTDVAPIRSSLIKKGMLYSLSHGDTAFTVPLFDGFMRRTLPLEVPG